MNSSPNGYIRTFYTVTHRGFCLFWGFFWLHCTACGILVPHPETEPGPLTVRTQREFLSPYSEQGLRFSHPGPRGWARGQGVVRTCESLGPLLLALETWAAEGSGRCSCRGAVFPSLTRARTSPARWSRRSGQPAQARGAHWSEPLSGRGRMGCLTWCPARSRAGLASSPPADREGRFLWTSLLTPLCAQV